MMKKRTLLTCLAALMSAFVSGQVSGYDDVGVIVNDNSPESVEIGNYFKQVRNIPGQNIIRIQTVTDEQIDTIEFRKIQYQIKNYILQNQLEDQLNYLVTTKGVPFDIVVDSCTFSPNYSFTRCSSVESELSLLLSADSTKIIKQGYIPNPYFGSDQHFSRDESDIFLVSRLDGKTKEDVFNLIDNSGPETFVDKALGQFIFDISYLSDTNPTYDLFARMMNPAIDTLINRGWNTAFHGDTLVPENEDKVIGFVSFIAKSFHGTLNFDWQKGSFCEFIVTGPEFTFYDSLNFNGNIQLADVIDEGCVSGSGYVHSTWGSQITDYAILFARYTEERDDPYNLAESYYMAAKPLSWMNILLGDPKTTITTIGAGAVGEIAPEISAQLYPNPAIGEVKIGMNAVRNSAITIQVYDLLGNLQVEENRQIAAGRNDLELNILSLDEGLYFIQIIENGSGISFTKKLMVR